MGKSRRSMCGWNMGRRVEGEVGKGGRASSWWGLCCLELGLDFILIVFCHCLPLPVVSTALQFKPVDVALFANVEAVSSGVCICVYTIVCVCVKEIL